MKNNIVSADSKQFNRLKVITLILAILVCFTVICGFICVYKFYNKEREMAGSIDSLKQSINELEVRLDELNPQLDDEAKTFISDCNNDNYDLIFVGNSITRHPLADYWWSNERGMASSTTGKDYVHLTETALSSRMGGTKVNGYALNFAIWETQINDRSETYPVLDKYFQKGSYLDCVVVQLGENVNDASGVNSTYRNDYKNLIEHIKEKAPKAQIITVGDFWADTSKDSIKEEVAKEENVTYLDLSTIQGDKEYEAGMGTLVDGDDGKKHRINHLGVANHPGDKGMKWIAKKIVKAIR